MSTAKEFGALLREERGRLTQECVAKRSVVGQDALTRQRVSNIENGLLPTAGQLRCYLRGCGKPELFERFDGIRSEVKTGPSRAMPWRRRAIRVGSAVAAVLTAASVVLVLSTNGSGPIPAAVVAPECVEGFLCFWPEPGYGGAKVQLPPDWAGDGRQCVPLPFPARSMVNRSAERHWGYAGRDCAGGDRTILQHRGGTEPSILIQSYIHT
ncbi:peptidase inhibitor family I36 protein [Amycolatopsis speibonae]|uniref:Peptidase inhibitor family I36 protein n=1 Tax=Amycolatopsis speibonae TaxID=1450224 RepID=A0ABV7NSD5_9PSEU